MCSHTPPCPPATDPDGEAAKAVGRVDVQGWAKLCNGVVVFEDTGALFPNGQIHAPHRPH
ncbi:DUF5999 family protein [Streptomyces sp. NPDC056465]|uniref:DUF5999 family protein n=1 Tax=Streptomyces sp. NPDC056465 TaxID=3345829 RepID=UPI0036D03132